MFPLRAVGLDGLGSIPETVGILLGAPAGFLRAKASQHALRNLGHRGEMKVVKGDAIVAFVKQ